MNRTVSRFGVHFVGRSPAQGPFPLLEAIKRYSEGGAIRPADPAPSGKTGLSVPAVPYLLGQSRGLILDRTAREPYDAPFTRQGVEPTGMGTDVRTATAVAAGHGTGRTRARVPATAKRGATKRGDG